MFSLKNNAYLKIRNTLHPLAGTVSDKFRTGDFTGGLVEGIEEAGEQLAAHFPYDAATDRDELPNSVDFQS